jgi:hypothetical protein
MIRRLLLLLAGVFLMILLLAGVMYFASESGEVVTVRTRDAGDAVHETRLWIVEYDGSSWLRAGNPNTGWLARLTARPELEVVRDGKAQRFVGKPTPEARDDINLLMQEKYGWADSVVCFLFPRAGKVPVRLLPALPPAP